MEETESSEQSCSPCPDPSNRLVALLRSDRFSDVHTHYDRVFFEELEVCLQNGPQRAGKFRFSVRCDNKQWQCYRSAIDVADFDEQIHNCLLKRKRSRLPPLTYELLHLASTSTTNDLNLIVANYMTLLSKILRQSPVQVCCTNLMQFFGVNRLGEPVRRKMQSTVSAKAELSEPRLSTLESQSSIKRPRFYLSVFRKSFVGDRRKHGRVFGTELSQHVHRHRETNCVSYVEHNLSKGIYRISSVSSQVNVLKDMYDTRKTDHFDFEVVGTDAYTVACLLKMYFRLLPNKLLYALPEADLNKSDSVDDQVAQVREALQSLSGPCFRTTAYLMKHLAYISEQSVYTNMDAANLALVWSPNLFRVRSTQDEIMSMHSQNVLVEIMIRWHSRVFDSSDQTLPKRRSNMFKSQSNAVLTLPLGDAVDNGDSNGLLSPGLLLSPRSARECSRVRSEEPPGRSLITQVKRNLKVLGSNMKLSFRNLVKLSGRQSREYLADDVDYFPNYHKEPSTISLNFHMGLHQRTSSRGSHAGCSTDSASSVPLMAPRAELDSLSTDSFPFDASRYDNLDGRSRFV